MNKKFLIPSIVLLSIIMLFFLIRMTTPKEIDDVSPEIPCEQNCLEKSDILWIIPKFQEKPISENKGWCNQILSLNKTLGLHGVTHEYEEFGSNRNQTYLEEGIKIFEDCFNKTPAMFKPPQLRISEENKQLIKQNNMVLKGKFNQIAHKVYHCNDTGSFSNWVINLY